MISYKKFKKQISQLKVGMIVKYRENIDSTKFKVGIITYMETKENFTCQGPCEYCKGKIGINNKKPDCIVYSSHPNKWLIIDILSNEIFINERDFKI